MKLLNPKYHWQLFNAYHLMVGTIHGKESAIHGKESAIHGTGSAIHGTVNKEMQSNSIKFHNFTFQSAINTLTLKNIN